MHETVAINPAPSPVEALDYLCTQHQQLDARLRELEKYRSLSPEEQYEVALLKKRKLFLKDRIRSLESFS